MDSPTLRFNAGVLLVVAALALTGPSQAAATPPEPSIRVRLLELDRPAAVTVSATDGPLAILAGPFDAPVARVDAGNEATIRIERGHVFVETGGRGIYARTLRLVPEDGEAIGLAVAKDGRAAETSRYPGVLHVDLDAGAPAQLRLINEVPLEDYVAAVIAREYGFDDTEGAKAMAVLARTYALRSSGKFGPDYDHVDHVASQVYRGLDGVKPYAREAARQTQGEVLTYGGQLIDAVYHAASGGHTADNESVWAGAPMPYLRGRPDPYGRNAPNATWRSTLDRPRVLATLSKAYGFEVTGFHVGPRGADERVRTIDLVKKNGGTHTIRANDFRMHLLRAFGSASLRSTNFTVRRVGEKYEFEGRGNGHGVGLSQWGAHEMARQGASYEDILHFYYRGVTLTRLDDLPQITGRPANRDVAPVRAASVQERRPEPAEQPASAQEKQPEPAVPSPPKQRIGW